MKRLLFILFLVITVLFSATIVGANDALPANVHGYSIESLSDGRITDLGSLSGGLPMYLAFSSHT